MNIHISLIMVLALSGIFTCSCKGDNSNHYASPESETDSISQQSGEVSLIDSLPPLVIDEPLYPDDEPGWVADHIVIDKGGFTLKLYDKEGRMRMKFPVGVAINYGNKKRRGDHRTPEGEFKVTAIQPSSGWTHDFHDGKGVIKGCYGPWFIRLAHPITTMIGIHGTHLPESVGTRCTEGCIRLRNEDIAKLKEKVRPGMIVKILPGEEDEKVNKGK